MSTGQQLERFREDLAEANVPIWKEALFAADLLLLHSSPVYYGFGIPRGDGSAVIVIPGFLGTDAYLTQLHTWLGRIGYRPYFSGIGLNAECPNLLIQSLLRQNIRTSQKEHGAQAAPHRAQLGRRYRSLRSAQMPEQIASVITLASPFRGTVAHRTVLHAAEAVRKHIIRQHGEGVLPDCYTGHCTCNFLDSLRRELPECVKETAIYTRSDGIVDWRYCRTGDSSCDFEVPGTHIGLAFNSAVYSVIGKRLAEAQSC